MINSGKTPAAHRWIRRLPAGPLLQLGTIANKCIMRHSDGQINPLMRNRYWPTKDSGRMVLTGCGSRALRPACDPPSVKAKRGGLFPPPESKRRNAAAFRARAQSPQQSHKTGTAHDQTDILEVLEQNGLKDVFRPGETWRPIDLKRP